MAANSASSLPGSSIVILEKGRARFTLVVGATTPGAWRVRWATTALSLLAISLTFNQRSRGSSQRSTGGLGRPGPVGAMEAFITGISRWLR